MASYGPFNTNLWVEVIRMEIVIICKFTSRWNVLQSKQPNTIYAIDIPENNNTIRILQMFQQMYESNETWLQTDAIKIHDTIYKYLTKRLILKL